VIIFVKNVAVFYYNYNCNYNVSLLAVLMIALYLLHLNLLIGFVYKEIVIVVANWNYWWL